MTKTFEEVVVWQKAHQFVLLVYQITKYYPETERFGLTSQFQRAAVSIAANFSEGYGKLSQADKLRFMNIAQGSLEECRYYCILSRDLNYISDEQYQQLRTSLSETSFMLNSYIKAILENKFKDAMK
jgi:four helix bundle protein